MTPRDYDEIRRFLTQPVHLLFLQQAEYRLLFGMGRATVCLFFIFCNISDLFAVFVRMHFVKVGAVNYIRLQTG